MLNKQTDNLFIGRRLALTPPWLVTSLSPLSHYMLLFCFWTTFSVRSFPSVRLPLLSLWLANLKRCTFTLCANWHVENTQKKAMHKIASPCLTDGSFVRLPQRSWIIMESLARTHTHRISRSLLLSVSHNAATALLVLFFSPNCNLNATAHYVIALHKIESQKQQNWEEKKNHKRNV